MSNLILHSISGLYTTDGSLIIDIGNIILQITNYFKSHRLKKIRKSDLHVSLVYLIKSNISEQLLSGCLFQIRKHRANQQRPFKIAVMLGIYKQYDVAQMSTLQQRSFV